MHVGFLQFEEVLDQPHPREDLQRLVDPSLGDDYPINSVRKVICNQRVSKISDQFRFGSDPSDAGQLIPGLN